MSSRFCAQANQHEMVDIAGVELSSFTSHKLESAKFKHSFRTKEIKRIHTAIRDTCLYTWLGRCYRNAWISCLRIKQRLILLRFCRL